MNCERMNGFDSHECMIDGSDLILEFYDLVGADLALPLTFAACNTIVAQ